MTKPNLIALRLDPEMRERLESAARAEDRSISSMVRRIIAAWLARKEIDFPQPRRNDGKTPCGECHLRSGETCDICGAKEP